MLLFFWGCRVRCGTCKSFQTFYIEFYLYIPCSLERLQQYVLSLGRWIDRTLSLSTASKRCFDNQYPMRFTADENKVNGQNHMWVTTRASLFSLSHFFGHLSQPTHNPKPQWTTKQIWRCVNDKLPRFCRTFLAFPSYFVLSFFPPLSDGHRNLFITRSLMFWEGCPHLSDKVFDRDQHVWLEVYDQDWQACFPWRVGGFPGFKGMSWIYHGPPVPPESEDWFKGSLPTLKWNNPGYPGILHGGWWTQVKH